MPISAWRVLPVLIILLAAGLLLPVSAGPAGLPALVPPLNNSPPSPGVSMVREAVANPDWITEFVDPTTHYTLVSSLALDDTGSPRIAYDDQMYYGPFYGRIRYAWKNGGVWQHATIPVKNASGPSLALDGSGNPQIAFFRLVGPTAPGALPGTAGLPWGLVLSHAWKNSAGWHLKNIDNIAMYWYEAPSLKLAGSGIPKISYSGYAPASIPLKLASRAGGTWQIRKVRDPGSSGYILESSLALDQAGNPGIAYTNYTGLARCIEYTWKDSGGWHNDVVSGNINGTYPSLARDGSGKPRICYVNGDGMALVYAWKQGGTWYRETVDDGGYFLGSLALDSSGNPRIAYLKEPVSKDSGGRAVNGYPIVLRYAWKDGTGWHAETIEHAWGSYISLALDRTGKPSISYTGMNGTGYPFIKYATKGSYMGRMS